MADSKNSTLRDRALRYHTHPVAGKMEIQPTKPLANKRDLSLAYSPGVAFPCLEIEKDPNYAAKVTSRGNLVGVISNGTAVLGLGNIGALASKPVMEGKAVLFKKFANIDVFDIEIDETDVDKLVDTIASLEPTFGGINLEDIKAPECFLVERKLRERMKIPVFHDDQHGTAIVSAAAVYNGLRIVNKKIEDIKLVVSGSGAASIACTELLISMGLQLSNVLMTDSTGVVYQGRANNMNPWKEKFAADTDARTLGDAMDGADIFLGLSGPGVLKPDMVKNMARDPLILAMANPDPEILPEDAKAVRPDAILATGRSDYPNQVNNVLCFPFIFRGALDCGATTINEEMKMACVRAIADLAMKETTDVVAQAYAGESLKFGPDYLIPKPFDPRLVEELPVAVAKAAMESGVAERPIEDLEAYRKSLQEFVNRAGLFMEPVIQKAQSGPIRKLIYPEGDNEDVLLAIQAVVDESVAHPILLGRPDKIAKIIERLSLRLTHGDITIINPRDIENDNYWQHYHQLTGRRGISVDAAKNVMTHNYVALAAVMVSMGEADGMICGKTGRFHGNFRDVHQILGCREKKQHASSICTLLLPTGPLFLTDAFLTPKPKVEEIVKKTKAAIEFAERFGVKPKVALLSHSNFGTSNAPTALRMREAAAILRAEMPHVELDGEMHSWSAFNEDARLATYSDSKLTGQANILVLPSLDTANIALGLIRSLTDALLIGPFLTGLRKPAHIVIPSVTAKGIFNMSALTAADVELYEEAEC